MKSATKILIRRLKPLLLAYSLPTIVVILALNRETNLMLFSAHGGLGWLLSWLCWPWMVFISVKNLFKLESKELKIRGVFAFVSIILYSLITIPISNSVSKVLNDIWGLPRDGDMFWNAINFPISIFFSTS